MSGSTQGGRGPGGDPAGGGVVDDERAIERLILTYAELLDAGDLEGLADLLADAVLGSAGDPSGLRGRDQILDLFKSMVRIHEDGTPRTRHVTTNLIVDVDGDAGSATARSYFTVLQATELLPLQPIVAGHYHDRFERRGIWRFAERRFSMDLVGDVSQHLLRAPGPPP